MGIMAKLFTAMRGAATEAGESAVDHQALRILDQEMRDAESELNKAKGQLANVMAEKRGIEREVEELRKKTSEHENYVVAALDKGDEGLAADIAQKIAEFETDLAAKEQALTQYDDGVNRLKRNIKTTEGNLATMRRQISMVKVTETVQKASASAQARFSGSNSSMGSATESLQRIKKRQQQHADRMEAANELAAAEDGGDLERRMREAGITDSGSSGRAVLDRIRAQRAG